MRDQNHISIEKYLEMYENYQKKLDLAKNQLARLE
jgi:hypothetical protein